MGKTESKQKSKIHTPLEYYYFPISQPARTVHALLLVNNIPFEPKIVNFFTGETRKPEFLKINPSGQVPAIKDGDFTLAEAHAILRYICNTKKVAEHWYPTNPKQRALVDWYLDWHHFNVRPITYYLRAILAEKKGLPPGYDKEKEKEIFTAALERIETQLLETNQYLVSKDKPTIADLSAIFEICQLEAIGVDASKYKKISEWMDRMFKIEGVAKANEEFKKFVESQKQ